MDAVCRLSRHGKATAVATKKLGTQYERQYEYVFARHGDRSSDSGLGSWETSAVTGVVTQVRHSTPVDSSVELLRALSRTFLSVSGSTWCLGTGRRSEACGSLKLYTLGPFSFNFT